MSVLRYAPMDRRSIIFIIGMTALFFLVNNWFSVDQSKVGPSPINQPQTEIIISQARQPERLSARQLDTLKVRSLYHNIDFVGPSFHAVKQGQVFVGVSTENSLPEQVFFQPTSDDDNEQARGVQRLELRVKPRNVGDPFLYSKYPLLKLPIPWIPSEQLFPLSMVYFEGDSVYEVTGNAKGFASIDIASKPKQNALVFYKNDGQNMAYAIYDTKSNSIDYIDHMPDFDNYAAVEYAKDPKIKRLYDREQYYVLENEYIQLVFSNLNGALAEINLPFESDSHLASVVKEIGIDRVIATDYPLNDTFPQQPYYTVNEKGERVQLTPKQGGYYPLLRRDLLGSGGNLQINVEPHFYALNVFQEDKPAEAQEFTLKRFTQDTIEFELVESNRKISKVFRLPKNPTDLPYVFGLDLTIEGDARHLYLSAGIPEVELISGSFVPTLKYRALRNQKAKVEEIKPPKSEVSFPGLRADWYANGNGFFGIIIDPIDKSIPGLTVHPVSGEILPSRITLVDSQYDRYPASKYPGYAMHTPILSKPGVTRYQVFAGPFEKQILTTVDNTFINSITGQTPDFTEAQSDHGWFTAISKPFGKFLFIILNFFHSVTRSWGISIILLTIVLRILLYPLNSWSMKSMAKMRKVAPKLKEIQEKYKKDPKRVQLETMNLYRREGANPFVGCFPMIIQLPFLFGMLDVLKTSFQLRGATFIPGWIDNLAAPDVLFSWQYPIPFIGTSFHLLPILLGAIMFIQQKIASPSGSTQAVSDTERQQKFSMNLMTIFFTILFYKFPSGLNIYWISSTLCGIFQQWLINKKMGVTK